MGSREALDVMVWNHIYFSHDKNHLKKGVITISSFRNP